MRCAARRVRRTMPRTGLIRAFSRISKSIIRNSVDFSTNRASGALCPAATGSHLTKALPAGRDRGRTTQPRSRCLLQETRALEVFLAGVKPSSPNMAHALRRAEVDHRIAYSTQASLERTSEMAAPTAFDARRIADCQRSCTLKSLSIVRA